MDTAAIDSYIKAGRALKQKYDELKHGYAIRQRILQEELKPIVGPLQNLSEKIDSQFFTRAQVEKTEGDGPLTRTFLSGLHNQKPDLKYGIYKSDGDLYVGRLSLKIENDNFHFSNGRTYKGTPGLWELLALDIPKNYTDEDMRNYAEIVVTSDTYKQRNDPYDTHIKSSRGFKYVNIIRPILLSKGLVIRSQPAAYNSSEPSTSSAPSTSSSASSTPMKLGAGLKKTLTNAPVEYVYWNTVDELLDRLYIVYGEIKAGNNSKVLHNELINILQEIKEI